MSTPYIENLNALLKKMEEIEKEHIHDIDKDLRKKGDRPLQSMQLENAKNNAQAQIEHLNEIKNMINTLNLREDKEGIKKIHEFFSPGRTTSTPIHTVKHIQDALLKLRAQPFYLALKKTTEEASFASSSNSFGTPMTSAVFGQEKLAPISVKILTFLKQIESLATDMKKDPSFGENKANSLILTLMEMQEQIINLDKEKNLVELSRIFNETNTFAINAKVNEQLKIVFNNPINFTLLRLTSMAVGKQIDRASVINEIHDSVNRLNSAFTAQTPAPAKKQKI